MGLFSFLKKKKEKKFDVEDSVTEWKKRQRITKN